MKKPVILVLLAVILFAMSSCSANNAAENVNTNVIENVSTGKTENTDAGRITHDGGRGEPNLEELRVIYAHEKLATNYYLATALPDSFGGAYLDGWEKCVVLLTDTSDVEAKNKVLEVTEYDDVIVFEPCKYSYWHMDHLRDDIEEYKLKKRLTIDMSAISVKVDIEENRVLVGLADDISEIVKPDIIAMDTEYGGECIIFS